MKCHKNNTHYDFWRITNCETCRRRRLWRDSLLCHSHCASRPISSLSYCSVIFYSDVKGKCVGWRLFSYSEEKEKRSERERKQPIACGIEMKIRKINKIRINSVIEIEASTVYFQLKTEKKLLQGVLPHAHANRLLFFRYILKYVSLCDGFYMVGCRSS